MAQLLPLVGLQSLLACAPARVASSQVANNGEIVPSPVGIPIAFIDEANADFPHVCTGALLKGTPRRVLAAAHCLVTQNTRSMVWPTKIPFTIFIAGTSATPTKIYVHKDAFSPKGELRVAYDAALIEVNDDPAFRDLGYAISGPLGKNWGPYSTIGYGSHFLADAEADKETAGILGRGGVKIVAWQGGYIEIQGRRLSEAEKGETIIGFGDSGAPLLTAGNEIVGVGSMAGGTDNVGQSYFANLLFPETRDFLTRPEVHVTWAP